MSKAAPGTIAPEAIQGLNEELHEVRALYNAQDIALMGLHSAVAGIESDFQLGLISGKVPEPSRQEELRAVADTLPSVLEQAAAYGDMSQQFVDRLQHLITTKADGTTITGSINPLFVNSSKPERNYVGDKRGLPKLYVVSGLMRGRVVGTQYRSKRPELRTEAITGVGIWVWPDNVKEWTNRHDDGPKHLSLLNESVEFVGHVADCKLPAPAAYNPKYGISID